MRTWLDIHPTGRKHCPVCKRWRHGLDFGVRKWTDYSCTMPTNLSSNCNVCLARKSRAKHGYKLRGATYAHGLPGSAEHRAHIAKNNKASKKRRRKHKDSRDKEAEYQRIWRNAKRAEAKRKELEMARRKNEDVQIRGECPNAVCEAHEFAVYINGRYNAGGEFEAHDDSDLICIECDTVLALTEP